MAEQIVNPKELKGLALPALRQRGGYFASKQKYDVAWGDVLLTLFTPIGTRVGNRRFGSALHLALFDPNIGQQIGRVQYIIAEALLEWCPHIILRETFVQVDRKQINITIVFSLTSDAQKQERTVAISRSNVTSSVAAARLA